MFTPQIFEGRAGDYGDGYDGISIAWGEDKALIFAWDRNNNAYDTREMTVSDWRYFTC